MNGRLRFHKSGLVLALFAAVAAAHAQPYPQKPVRIVVPFAPGGGVDFTARIIAQRLTEIFSQQTVVDNRPGAGGIIGSEIVAKAPPDGYTLLMGSTGTLSINPGLYPKLPYDPGKDFTAITQVALVPNIVVVHPSLPVKSIRELIAFAKVRPGQLSYGTGGNGTSNHLSGELFKHMAGIEILHVPYKVGAQATSDLIAGQLTVMFDNLPTSLPHVKSRKLRALAVTSSNRSPAAPEIPTVTESGLKGYEVTGWAGLLAPVTTSAEVVTRIHATVVQLLSQTDVRERLLVQGAEVVGDTPQQFAAFIRAETAKWGNVIRDAGIKLN